MALNKTQKARLIATIKANTKAWGEEWSKEEKDKVTLTDKEKRVAEYLSKNVFGCNNSYVTELMSILLEKDLKPHIHKPTKKFNADRLVAVVPVCGFDSHDYPKGIPAVTTTDKQFDRLIMATGDRGNSLSQGSQSQIRAATDKEIEDMPDVQLEAVARNIIFL